MPKSKHNTPGNTPQENTPKKWQLEQRRAILRDNRALVGRLWERAICQSAPEVREMLLAMRALERTCEIVLRAEDRQRQARDDKHLDPNGAYWTHEKVWADVHRAERALNGGDYMALAVEASKRAEAAEKGGRQ